MPAPAQLLPYRFQSPAHAFRNRLPSQPEAALPCTATVVCHAEEVECLRSTLPASAAVRCREPAELQQAGLVGVQVQPELAEPLLQVPQEPFRVSAILEPRDIIIGIPVAVARRLPDGPRTDPDVRANASGSSLRL